MDQNNNQALTPQPTAEPVPMAAQPPAAPPISNPGKTLGIVGIVLSFVFLQLIGIVLSIISTVKSTQAKASPTLGIIGIVLNAIGLVFVPIMVMIMLVAHNGIQERAKLAAAESTASAVAKRAEAYYALEGKYPATIDDFADHDESKLVEGGKPLSVTDGVPMHYEDVQYEVCGPSGAHVVYYDPTVGGTSNETLVDVPLVNASRAADCR
ncbi:MAG TPA: hypothetical protein PK096_01770 [Candidatus Saccharibacteria bacterium]|nr:hypothetical protein [Candidatus Saccharibacteria bacterium]HRK94074.1 hypothetical protein [Candidatus Saccharibacteria bacterium]